MKISERNNILRSLAIALHDLDKAETAWLHAQSVVDELEEHFNHFLVPTKQTENVSSVVVTNTKEKRQRRFSFTRETRPKHLFGDGILRKYYRSQTYLMYATKNAIGVSAMLTRPEEIPDHKGVWLSEVELAAVREAKESNPSTRR